MSSRKRVFHASGQVLRAEPAREQLALELEAQDDVEAVARLVRVDPDERAPRAVHDPVEPLQRDVSEPIWERRLHSRVEPAPERERAPDDVLPEPALRLVHRRRHPSAERRSIERGADAELVQAVAALVHRAEERDEVVLVVPRGQADVAEPEGRLERVHGEVEAKRVPGRAEPLDQLAGERVLLGGRIRARREARRHPPPRAPRRAPSARAGARRTPPAPAPCAAPPRTRRARRRTGRRTARSIRPTAA